MKAEFRYDDIDLIDIVSLAVEADGSITVGFYTPFAAFEIMAEADLATRRPIRFRARFGSVFSQENMGVLTRVSLGTLVHEITVRPMPQKLESQ